MKKRNAIKFVAVLFSMVLWSGGSAWAQKSPPPGTSPSGVPGWDSRGSQTQEPGSGGTDSKVSDTTFAKKAASGGMAEVKLGKLAQERGSSGAVKEFGKRMETDHSKAGEKLKEIASKNNIALPEKLEESDQATYDHLSKLSGAEFDRVYAQHMVTDHEEDIEEFKNEASMGKNADIKGFASSTLPTLQDHLRQAREMEKSVSAKESSKNTQ